MKNCKKCGQFLHKNKKHQCPKDVWNKGKKMSEKTITKMINSQRKRTDIRKGTFKKGHKTFIALGIKNGRWRGGISKNGYPDEWDDKLREIIRERDNYICQECGVHQEEIGRKLDIHHIDYNKENCNLKNLISLCRICHIKTNSNRKYWEKYFKTLAD